MSRVKEILEHANHPLPKKGDIIRITEVHSENSKPTFKVGDLVEVKSAYRDKGSGMVFFNAKKDPFDKVRKYSSKTYDWEIFGEEYEAVLKAQEKTGEFVQQQSEKRFEEVWENFRKEKVFPEQLFSSPRAKWMFAMFYYSAFEDRWNACCLHAMDKEMSMVELCIDELGKVTGVNIKEDET